MENLLKKVYEITNSETIRSLANRCKTEKQLLKLIFFINASKALKKKEASK
tara:strand:+ start:127 stop:279 length:153 start_codon:yes stop_codon:yes gene_type:complete